MCKCLVFTVLIFLFVSCKSSLSKEDHIDNWPYHIRKVITYYSKDPADSLKLRAAEFLVAEMRNHYEITGRGIRQYRKDLVNLFRDTSASYESVVGQLDLIKYDPSELSVRWDIDNVTSRFLIRHIDKAFEIYSYPWCRTLDFQTFCETILPYRIAHEPLELWLDSYNKHFDELVDYFQTHSLNDSLKCMMTLRYLSPEQNARKIQYSALWDLPPLWYLNVLTRWDFATCRELAMLGMYSFRSLGMPVYWDFTPKWANGAVSHNWNAIEIHGKTIPFLLKDDQYFGRHLSSRPFDRVSKVFRHTFAVQPESLVIQPDRPTLIPALFNDPCLKDVTDLYVPCFDISVPLDDTISNSWAYLLSFDNRNWIPVDWGRVSGGCAHFHKVPVGNVYMVGYLCQDTLRLSDYPFLTTDQGEIHVFRPDSSFRQTLHLSRKFPCKNVYAVFDQIYGGIFQGACKADFSDAVNLYVIGKLKDLKPVKVSLSDTREFRYFRYLSAPGGHCNMAEIELWDHRGNQIVGHPISSANFYPDKSVNNVFDGNPLTYAFSVDSSGSWVGLTLPQGCSVGSFTFTPHTDENYVVKGNNYELFYYDHGWRSVGVRQAAQTGEILVYKHMPTNALWLLHNTTKGREERIFIYNGSQVWF